ncbi:MAG: bifunctional glutamate N-acetyltransferase/amino-acid acetyltransferase ArgJ [Spirochaetes bacterium]|uniref:Arginine biosynthesis bifunctional protein ArgJ n=1 Tax=Candidatus Ornithospirochaeta stercoripullorum TaxID=2840899 RepID=A0A9D9E1S3_9SPIO|nr:bifunctional glutamate N-acetyltransferase/amino-acid acetyltransferase ArgJ [Candidatus Ornithospirochaeta stercoripullorum]
MEIINGGVTSAIGYKAAGMHAGLKKAKKDMALLVSEQEAVTAAVFTTNKVKAAPVIWDQGIARNGCAKAVVINSGNANACTGKQGLVDAEETAEEVAKLLSTEKSKVYVASTGVIGVPLDMPRIKAGVAALSSLVSQSGGSDAAEAICTTDTFRKEAAATVMIGNKLVTIGGMAKGSGMIHPNMATMLAFITTDAVIGKETLQQLLGYTVEETFNMISVDGDTSTNDSCIVLANGMAGNEEILSGTEEYEAFAEAFHYVLGTLAKLITRDGEGAGRFIEMNVINALSDKDAKVLARSVISSSLVKAAFFGSDANWGRILCAMGYSGADFDPSLVDLSFSSAKGTIETVKGGEPLPFSEEKAKEILLEKEISVTADCHQGVGKATAWGCDLTYDYVRINGDYRS